jgi:uncharacterized protein
MQENRIEADIYIRKLHEMFPELKEKYHVSYLGIFGSYIGENRGRGASWTYLLSSARPQLFLELLTLKTTFRML